MGSCRFHPGDCLFQGLVTLDPHTHQLELEPVSEVFASLPFQDISFAELIQVLSKRCPGPVNSGGFQGLLDLGQAGELLTGSQHPGQDGKQDAFPGRRFLPHEGKVAPHPLPGCLPGPG